MFWNDEDLQELEGTTISGERCFFFFVQPDLGFRFRASDKIGKTEAEEDYNNKLLPAIKVMSCMISNNIRLQNAPVEPSRSLLTSVLGV